MTDDGQPPAVPRRGEPNGGAHTLLAGALDLLTDPDNFTTGTWARDRHGRTCSAVSPEAVRWDTGGAIDVLGVLGGYTIATRIHAHATLRAAAHAGEGVAPTAIVDRGHTAAVALLTAAVRIAAASTTAKAKR